MALEGKRHGSGKKLVVDLVEHPESGVFKFTTGNEVRPFQGVEHVFDIRACAIPPSNKVNGLLSGCAGESAGAPTRLCKNLNLNRNGREPSPSELLGTRDLLAISAKSKEKVSFVAFCLLVPLLNDYMSSSLVCDCFKMYIMYYHR